MKTFLLMLLLGAGLCASAQQGATPAIQQGSRLNYSVNVNGEERYLTVSLDSINTDYVKFGWRIRGYGSGGWIMKKPSLEKGIRNAWEQPNVGEDTELPEDQVILWLSKASLAALQKDKKTEIDQQVYTVAKTETGQQFSLAGKPVDALFLQNQTNGAKMWFLQKPGLPVLLKMQGNPYGYDLELRSVE